jgi:hypothetical protein
VYGYTYEWLMEEVMRSLEGYSIAIVVDYLGFFP